MAALTFGNALPTRANDGTIEPPVEGEDYYEKLGVTKIINAAGTYTHLTASTMPPSVQAAVVQAAKHPVRLAQLQKAAGEYLARRLRCEAAIVTAGAASAVTLGTAACVTLGNEAAAHSIPIDMTGLKNEVVIQKAHHYDYDHALRNCGIKFVDFRNSHISGRGVFAKRHFNPGDFIVAYAPKQRKVDVGTPEAAAAAETKLTLLSEKWSVIIPDTSVPGGWLCNHSCDPNAAIFSDGEGRIQCTRSISPGEEVTIFYGWVSQNEPERDPCLCRSAPAP
jgi:hypothetical protein